MKDEFLLKNDDTSYNPNKIKILNKIEGIKHPQLNECISANYISCGEDYSFIVDSKGEVYTFGLNRNGQLGLGNQHNVNKPEKVKTLEGYNITQIKSSGDVNFAITNNGQLFMWPWKDVEANINFYPLVIPLNNIKICQISCGHNFTILLTDIGMLYSFGMSNKYGQLGHGDYENRYKPTILEFFKINSERITQISCGYKHVLAKSLFGRTYSWGLGVKGQLGLGEFASCCIPNLVIFKDSFLKIIQISAGFRNSVFLSEARKIYFTGCLGNYINQNVPIPYNPYEKIPELKNEMSYSIVKISSSWNKSFSVLNATLADTTRIKKLKSKKLANLLLTLATKWLNETIKAPFINEIKNFFFADQISLKKT